MAGVFDLAARARQAVVEAGFEPDYSALSLAEARRAAETQLTAPTDLSHLLWSSIDNAESRDLDQLEYAEPASNGSIRLLLAIADVASYVLPGSATDQRARHNTVSLYTAGKTFHLLPEELSTGRTSLLENQSRLALVVDMAVESDGQIHDPRVYHAKVQNHAKLIYEQVSDWLGSGKRMPVLDVWPGLIDQLRLQVEIAKRLMALRKRMGALTLSSYEARPVLRQGRCVDLAVCEPSDARDLIESFMIAANVATATFLKHRGSPIIERAVAAPRRWDRIVQLAANYGFTLPDAPDPKPLSDFLVERRTRDPRGFAELSLAVVKLLGPGEYVVEPPHQQLTGHFGLALDDYSHSTAPNRRYSDLIIQRLLFASLRGEPVPYSDAELQVIAQRCTEREDLARKVERFMRKVAAADMLSEEIGRTFEAVVTGASPKGTYVRLRAPAVEGKVVRAERGIDVGDRVRVRLLSADPARGFIDFERL